MIIVLFLSKCDEIDDPEYTDAARAAAVVIQHQWLEHERDDNQGLDQRGLLARDNINRLHDAFPELPRRFTGAAAKFADDLLAPTEHLIAAWNPGSDAIVHVARELLEGADASAHPVVVELARRLEAWHNARVEDLAHRAGRVSPKDAELLPTMFDVLFVYGPFDDDVVPWRRLARRWQERSEESRRRREVLRGSTTGPHSSVGENESADEPDAGEVYDLDPNDEPTDGSDDVADDSDPPDDDEREAWLKSLIPRDDLMKGMAPEELWQLTAERSDVRFETLVHAMRMQLKNAETSEGATAQTVALVTLEALAVYGIRHLYQLRDREFDKKQVDYHIGRLLLAEPVYNVVTDQLDASLRLDEIEDMDLREWTITVVAYRQPFVDLGLRGPNPRTRDASFVYEPGKFTDSGLPVLTPSFNQFKKRYGSPIVDLYVSTTLACVRVG